MRKFIWATIFLLLIIMLVPVATSAAPAQQTMRNWRAEYYANPDLSGPPRISRVDATVNHDWGLGSPALDIPRDNFSARWTTITHFEKGSYLFILNVDDGARVWINGELIIDAWTIGYKEDVKAKIRLPESGDYEIQVAYFEHIKNAKIHLEILQLGGEDDIIGAWHGEYFNNRFLKGKPAMTRQDGCVCFDWGLGSPGPKIARDNFSVRWTRSVYLKEGRYHFRVQHDDGMTIYIDGKVIYDSWYDQPVTYQTAMVPIKEGFRTLTVEYYDHVGNAVAQMQIDEDPGNYEDNVPDPDGVGVTVTVNSADFTWDGPNRFVGRGGFDGGIYYYSPNTNGAPRNGGRWNVPISTPGNYEIFAYIPTHNASTRSAQYRVYHFGRFIDRRLDQSRYQGEFTSLGIYWFDGVSDEFVTLHNSTGENPNSTQVAFDAMKFVKR